MMVRVLSVMSTVLLCIRYAVAHVHHRTFRGPGRPARVLEHGDVIGIGGCLCRFGRRPREIRKTMDPRFPRDREGPVARLLEVLPPLDGIEMAQRRLQEFRSIADDDPLDPRARFGLYHVVPE